MNRVLFTWKRINSTFPELNNDNETRGYDREEIQHLLEFAGPLENAINIDKTLRNQECKI